MEDAKTVRYVSKDPIQNLKIRVTLWRLSVHKSRVNIVNPNDTGQAQGQVQGQARAPQPQLQPVAQAPVAQQPVPHPLPQPLPHLAGQISQPGAAPAGAALPAGPGQQMPGPLPMQQVPPQQQMQPQSTQLEQQQQQQQAMPSQGHLGPMAGQAVAEAFNMARPAPGPQPRARMPPANAANRGGRQRMSVQERLDAAAAVTAAAPGMPMLYNPRIGTRGWEPSAAATAGTGVAMPADPFVYTPEWIGSRAGVWGDSGSGAAGRAVPYPRQQLQGRPLGEAIEDPSTAQNAAAQSQQQALAQGEQPPQQQEAGTAPAADAPQAQTQGQSQGEQGQLLPQSGATAVVIPLQPDIPPVPYGSLGPEARMVALGELPEVPPTTPPNLFPEKFKTSRVFGWQEKVYSRTEVAASQAAAQQASQEAATARATTATAAGPVSEAFAVAGQGQTPAAASAARAAASVATAAGPQGPTPAAAVGGRGSGVDPAAAAPAVAAATQVPPVAPPPAPPAAAVGVAAAAAAGAGQPGLPLGQPSGQLGAVPLFGGQAQQQQQQQAVPNKRLAAFGSQTNLTNKRLDPRISGSILFTYVQTDEFCIQEEMGRTVTTSAFEGENWLVSKLLGNSKGRQQVLAFRSMYIVADLGDESDLGSVNEKVLVSIRAFPDGSFEMCPGFSKEGAKYRFEDIHGGIFEYTVENASAADIPSLEKRTAKLERAVVARAEELRRAALKEDFEKPPGDDRTRLLLLAEIQSAADFPLNRLYIEYVVRWDPELWELMTPWPGPEPGIVQGVTHISLVTTYPPDRATDTPSRDVAHFAHPVELEWVSRSGGGAPSNMYPAMFFQVCTLDKLNRYTCQGYGWLSLNGQVPGCRTHVVHTWKPLGTIRDRQAEFFIGGSAELADLAYLATPSGFSGKILNKYGFKTESIGAVKVRLNSVVQRYNPDAEALAAGRRFGGGSLSPARASQAGLARRNSKKDMSLKMVVERARRRLQEARGTDDVTGGDVAVRPGVVSEKPTIIVHPQDTVVAEESTVRFKVAARGLPPLKYEWFKDDRRLLTATADKPELILVQVGLDAEGSYYCQVSNKEGSANSNKAALTVTRAARVTRAGAGDRESRTPRRPGRTSPGGSQSASTPVGTRLSRLARLDAAVQRSLAAASVAGSEGGGMSPTGGGPPSQTSSGGGGGGGGAATSPPRTSATGGAAPSTQKQQQPFSGEMVAAGSQGGDLTDLASLPSLPPSTMPQPLTAAQAPTAFPAAADAVEAGGGSGGGSGGEGGLLPPSVAAAATSSFQRRPPRRPSAAGSGGSRGGGSGGGGGLAVQSAATEVVEEVVEEVVSEAQPQRPARRRMGLADDAPPVRPPQRQQPSLQPAARPQRPTARRDDDDDLEAEDIE